MCYLLELGFRLVPEHMAGEITQVLIIKHVQCFNGPVKNCFTISNVSIFVGPLCICSSLFFRRFLSLLCLAFSTSRASENVGFVTQGKRGNEWDALMA